MHITYIARLHTHTKKLNAPYCSNTFKIIIPIKHMRYSIESCINYSTYIKEYGFKLYLSVYVGPTSKNSRGHVIDG